MVPKRRGLRISRRRKRPGVNTEAHLTVQPILLLQRETNRLVLDGLKRLVLLREKGAALVRCVIIKERQAFFLGREGIAVLDRKGRPLALDKAQRTFKTTLPPSIDGNWPGPGEDYDANIRPALASPRRELLPEVPEQDADLQSNRLEGLQAAATSRAGQIIERDRNLIEETFLATLAPHIATVKYGRLHMTLEMTPYDARKLDLNLQLEFQEVLDRHIAIDRNIFRKGNAGPSVYELFLIRFLLRLFDTIESLHKEIMALGIRAPRAGLTNGGAINPRVGHTIVAQDPRYLNAIGSFANLDQMMKKWSDIATLSHGVYAHGLHAGLFGIGLRRGRGAGAGSLVEQEEHAYELLQATLKALRPAHNQTIKSRDLRQHNNGKGSNSDLRFDLDHAVNGEPSTTQAENWHVDRIFRQLLALHARLNPAKIWRDEAGLTLMYQWLIALGDLTRHGSMIVTCHMAQEFFHVQRLRSGGDNPALDAEWAMFDEALEVAVSGHPASTHVVREIVDFCAKGMQSGRAQRVIINTDGPAFLDPNPLSKETSRLAEAAIWLT